MAIRQTGFQGAGTSHAEALLPASRGEVCPEGRGGGGRRGRRSVERHAGRACLTSASEARFWFVVAVVTIWLG